jgi:glycosyltransferase involved in cell wall biosynthesis
MGNNLNIKNKVELEENENRGQSTFISNNCPFFSIVVPIFNVEKYLEKCLSSLVNQSFNDYEIICVDDGSTDSSGKICNSYQAIYPKKIRVLHKINQGLGYARNSGISMSIGKYLLFVDSDDYLYDREVLKRCFRFITDNEFPDIVSVRYLLFDDVTRKTSSDVLLKKCKNEIDYFKYRFYSFSAWSKVVKRDYLLRTNCLFDRGYSEDVVWSLKLLINNPKISYEVETPVYVYRTHRSGSIVNQNASKFTNDWVHILYAVDYYKRKIKGDKRLLLYYSSVYYHLFFALSKTTNNVFKDKVVVKCLKDTKDLLKLPCDYRMRMLKVSILLLGIKQTMKVVNIIWQQKNKN